MKIHGEEKYDRLRASLGRLGSVAVAFSGGADSAFLLKVAHDVLGDHAIAVTAVSPTYPAEELRQARRIAKDIGIRLLPVHTDELRDENFSSNRPDRCFFCKTGLFSLLRQQANRLGIRHIAYGANADDTDDFRPGMKAAARAHAKAPLLDAGLTKEEIRAISRGLGLTTWDKPSSACLASRIPYGTRITIKALRMIESGEALLHTLGFRQCRIRCYNDIARIEVLPEDLHRLLDKSVQEKIVRQLKRSGFMYVTVDLEGYRTGSMNMVIRSSSC